MELQPYFPEAYYNLGVMAQADGNYEKAAVYYQRSIDQDRQY